MTSYQQRRLRIRHSNQSNKITKTSFVVSVAFAVMFACATWLTLTSVYNQQQITHCEQGWQRACESKP